MIKLIKKLELSVSDIIDNLEKKHFGRNIFLFVMGMLVSALAFNLFFEPYDVIPMGSSGLVLIISKFVDIDISLLSFIISVIILIIAFVFFGWDYSLKLIAVTILYPTFLKSTTLITRFIDLENTSLFLIMVIGGGMLGLSSGLIRKSGYNPGGFSIFYDIFYKYLHISIGTSGIIVNGILIVVSGFIFGMEKAVYAIIGLLVSSYTI